MNKRSFEPFCVWTLTTVSEPRVHVAWCLFIYMNTCRAPNLGMSAERFILRSRGGRPTLGLFLNWPTPSVAFSMGSKTLNKHRFVSRHKSRSLYKPEQTVTAVRWNIWYLLFWWFPVFVLTNYINHMEEKRRTVSIWGFLSSNIQPFLSVLKAASRTHVQLFANGTCLL